MPEFPLPEAPLEPDAAQSVPVAESETTQPSTRRDTAVLQEPGLKRVHARSTPLLVAGFVLSAGLLAGACWVYVRGSQPFLIPTHERTQPRAAARPAQSHERHSSAATPTPAALAPRAEPSGVEPSTAAPLAASVPSERNAPSCDELLADSSPDQRSRWELVRAARRALVRGDVDGSQRALCRANQTGPADAIVSFELAQLLLLRRDASAAAQFARQATALAPRSPRALGLLGDAAIRAGNPDEARAAWLDAFDIAAGDAAGIERLVKRSQLDAERALAERDPARAERLLRRVLAFQPNHATAPHKLALALSRLGLDRDAAR